jgi:hypothetical protein
MRCWRLGSAAHEDTGGATGTLHRSAWVRSRRIAEAGGIMFGTTRIGVMSGFLEYPLAERAAERQLTRPLRRPVDEDLTPRPERASRGAPPLSLQSHLRRPRPQKMAMSAIVTIEMPMIVHAAASTLGTYPVELATPSLQMKVVTSSCHEILHNPSLPTRARGEKIASSRTLGEP